jgi:hypothetical protein
MAKMKKAEKNQATEVEKDYETYDPLTEEQLRDWTNGLWGKRATATTDELSRQILQDFCTRDFYGLPQSGYTLSWMTDAIDKILDGANAKNAFQLTGKGRGRKKGKTRSHNHSALAACFCLLRRNGLKVEAANNKMTKAIGADRSTIHRAMREHRPYADPKQFDDRTLTAIAEPYLAKIGRILKRVSC